MTIKEDIRPNVITLSQEGKSRNEIAKILHISQGSTSNILKAWKENKDKYNQSTAIAATAATPTVIINQTLSKSIDEITQQSSQVDASISRGVDMNETGSLASESQPLDDGTGLAASISDLKEQESFEPDVDFADESVDPNIFLDRDVDKRVIEKDAFEIEKEMLQKQIEDFKTEIKKYGIDIDSRKFVDTLHTFQRFNFDCNKMVEMFIEVQDVLMEKKNIQRLKEETDNSQRALESMLSSLGVGLDQAKQAIVSLMTLENFGVGVERIISIAHEQRFKHQQRVQYTQRNVNQGRELPPVKYRYGYKIN